MDVIYGVHPVAECLKAKRRAVKKLWVSDADRLWELAQAAGAEPEVKAFFVNRDACERLCTSPQHQGVVAEVGPIRTWIGRISSTPIPTPSWWSWTT